MKRKLSLLGLLLIASASQLTGESPAAPSATEPVGASMATFERLEAKNRSRLFSEVPSPSGEHYFYLSDYNLSSNEGLNPEIQVRPETRSVKVVVKTYATNSVKLPGGEASLGTVQLRGVRQGQEVDVQTDFALTHPLEIQVQERKRPESD